MFARTLAILMLPAAAAALGLAAGCSEGSSAAPPGGENAQAGATPEKSGAELWAENCNRCHNVRPPPSFSDAQWQVIVHHMRERANLTGEEARAITVFLQSANQ